MTQISKVLKVIKFDKNLQKHKLSSQIVIIKLHDVIEIKPSNDLSIIYRDTNKKKISVKNDIIKKINGEEINSIADIDKIVKSRKYYDPISIEILTKDNKLERFNFR